MTARRLPAIRLTIIVLLLLLHVTAYAQQERPSPVQLPAEDARIARLVGLARVWGAVKYFHPYLAYREIDWDRALVEIIPKVNAARTPREYQAAVNQMLSVLNDTSTRAEIETQATAAATSRMSVASTREPVRVENGVLVIDAMQVASTAARDRVAFSGLVGKIGEAIPSAKAIVMDARGASKNDGVAAYFFNALLRQLLPQMLDTNVTLGSTRYRMHSGYQTQAGTGSGSYYSALINVAPETIAGQNTAKRLPLVFIINDHTPAASDVLGGLQSANRAFVIQEGERAQGPGGDALTMRLSDGISVRIRTSEAINPDGSNGFQPDAVVPESAGGETALREAMQAAQQNKAAQARRASVVSVTTQVSQRDNAYAEMAFPDSSYRLLALFRFWNVINYFYPYKNLIGESWETVLPRYIPKFEANTDAVDYQLTVREMVTEMRDSHGGVQNANASAEKLGAFLPPLIVRYIEGRTVVMSVLEGNLAVKVGDVVLTVDGEPVEKRREFLSRYIAASTPQALMRNVHANLLRGQRDTAMRLRVRGTDGAVREVEITRSLPRTDKRLLAAAERSTPVVQVLQSGYGYVDLARLQVAEVEKMFETIKGTPAVIFDMRGYPNGTAWAIAPRLTEKRTPVAALFSRPLLEAASLSDSELADVPNYTFAQQLPERSGDAYRGKVVMLINEDAISQAEHTCMFFEAATDVTFIGTPTMGANGDVTFMILPGNLLVSFTGHNVRHADGRQLQRIGIQPNITVAPTIGGVVAGRDEVLDRAVRYLQENVRK